MADGAPRLSRYSSYLAWPAGAFMVLLALGVLARGEGILGTVRAVIAAAVLVVAAGALIPPLRSRLSARTGMALGRWGVVVIAVSGLAVGMMVALPTTDSDGGPASLDTVVPPTPTQIPASPAPAAQTTAVSGTHPAGGGATGTATPSPPRSERNEFHVTVLRVVDGDTLEVRYADGDTEVLRLLGVDTPEVAAATDPLDWDGIPDTTDGRDHLEEWGSRAESFAASRLERGEGIRIVVDEQADRRDVYGRLLVYVYDDGELFNRLLLEEGYARLHDATFIQRPEYASAEAAAQRDAVGVWDFEAATAAGTPTSTPMPTPTPTPDAPHDAGEGDLEVVLIHADAAGNDHENLNDEYLVFENTGGGELDLTGWRVQDEADHSYTFPSGFSLEPWALVTLSTGSGTATDTELYWGSGSAVWNNDGDTIYVYDDSGSLVLEWAYA